MAILPENSVRLMKDLYVYARLALRSLDERVADALPERLPLQARALGDVAVLSTLEHGEVVVNSAAHAYFESAMRPEHHLTYMAGIIGKELLLPKYHQLSEGMDAILTLQVAYLQAYENSDFRDDEF